MFTEKLLELKADQENFYAKASSLVVFFFGVYMVNSSCYVHKTGLIWKTVRSSVGASLTQTWLSIFWLLLVTPWCVLFARSRVSLQQNSATISSSTAVSGVTAHIQRIYSSRSCNGWNSLLESDPFFQGPCPQLNSNPTFDQIADIFHAYTWLLLLLMGKCSYQLQI